MTSNKAFTGVGVPACRGPSTPPRLLPRRIPRFGRTQPRQPEPSLRRSAGAAPPPRLDSPWIGAPPRRASTKPKGHGPTVKGSVAFSYSDTEDLVTDPSEDRWPTKPTTRKQKV